MPLKPEQCDRFINMRLYQARVLLDQSKSPDIDNALYQGLLHGCVHQLNSAVTGIVARVCTQFAFELDQSQLMGSSAQAVRHFEQQMQLRERQSGELNELLQLLESGWLKELNQAYQAFYDMADLFSEKGATQNTQLIMTDLGSDSKPLPESCKLWLVEIKDLLNRYREAGFEW